MQSEADTALLCESVREADSPTERSATEEEVVAAAVLALFGWEPHVIVHKDALRCAACFREVGLWLFDGVSPSTDQPHSDQSAHATCVTPLQHTRHGLMCSLFPLQPAV